MCYGDLLFRNRLEILTNIMERAHSIDMIFRGARLRAARNAKGLSQARLSRRINAHVTSISDWERGANAPSGRHVASLSRELDVPVGEFYGDDEEESEPVEDLMTAIRRVVREEIKAGQS